jgi:hypothetical protein
VTLIVIMCKARSHERRPQIIARFRDVGLDMWEEIPAATRADHKRFESGDWDIDNPPNLHAKTTVQNLVGDEPSDDISPDLRQRHRFECRMCGDVKVERAENLCDKFNRLRDARPDNDKHVIPLHILGYGMR